MDSTHLDTCLEVVSDRQRRRILQRLRSETDGKTTVADLADHLHHAESARSTDASPTRDDTRIQLVHTHLPKLAEHGIVHHDQATDVVRYRPDERIERLLDSLPTDVAQAPPHS